MTQPSDFSVPGATGLELGASAGQEKQLDLEVRGYLINSWSLVNTVFHKARTIYEMGSSSIKLARKSRRIKCQRMFVLSLTGN